MIPLKDENPTSRRPWVTLAVMVACVAVYFLWQPTPFASTSADVDFAVHHAAIPCEVVHHRPLTLDELRATYVAGRDESCGIGSADSGAGLPHKQVWLSVVVSMFLHGSLVHLGGNLLFLWVFGNNVEDWLGPLRYALLYLVGGLVATLTFVLCNPHSTVALVGASGAIATVMGAYLVWFPDAPVRTLVFVVIVRIRAKWVLGLWFVLQFFTEPNSGVAWAAHVGGFVFGVLVGLVEKRRYQGLEDPTGGAGYGWFAS